MTDAAKPPPIDFMGPTPPGKWAIKTPEDLKREADAKEAEQAKAALLEKALNPTPEPTWQSNLGQALYVFSPIVSL